MENRITIVIVDKHQLVREMLRIVLSQEKKLHVLGEVANGLDAITIVSEIRPDIVISDIGMPEMNGIEVVRHIKAISPKTRTLIVTARMDDAAIFKALKAGVKGYVSKNASIADLIKAIEAIHRGEMWFERKLISRYFESEIDSEPWKNECPLTLNKGLTPREFEVLRCLTSGCTNKEIADSLYISEKTIKSHLNSIFKKLNVSRRLEAILFAIRQGLG